MENINHYDEIERLQTGIDYLNMIEYTPYERTKYAIDEEIKKLNIKLKQYMVTHPEAFI